MNTFEHEDEPSIDDSLDAQRETLRQSLDAVASDVGLALRDAGLNFPVFLTVPSSGNSLATIATPLDPIDDDWEHASAIACRIIAEKVGCDGLRARALTCAVANSSMAAADLIGLMLATDSD
jgi:hypothetical protein